MLAFLTKSKPAPPKTPAGPRDPVREFCEMIVFVAALVLMLKLFVVEAFVIPTGSMAETLYGNQKIVDCPECEHRYPVNCSEETEPQDGISKPVIAATCPNCRFRAQFGPQYSPAPRDGDRVLVHKALYPLGPGPDRGDVVVFKFPVAPQTNQSGTNYIKRLCGLGGETIAVYRGDLYVHPTLDYPADAKDDSGGLLHPRPAPGREVHLWEGKEPSEAARREKSGRDEGEAGPPGEGDGVDYTYRNAEVAQRAFEASRRAGFPPGGGFELVRKSPEQALAMRRLTYDNDHQSATLNKKRVPPRWAGAGFAADPAAPTAFTHDGPDRAKLEYAHRVGNGPTDLVDQNGTPVLQGGNQIRLDDWARVARPGGSWDDKLFLPARVTNFLGYNTGESAPPWGGVRYGNGAFWVPDLMLETRAQIADVRDEVALDLAKGSRRFRATFKDGKVSVGVAKLDGEPQEVASAPTRLTSAGSYRLRFCDFDGRLRVTVDGRDIDLGPGADIPPWDDAEAVSPGVDDDGYCEANDLKPARLYATGDVTLGEIKLWQDSYYTTESNRSSAVETLYVQPGHYLCLGDNSGFSSDSRTWGLVPERLLLGKALVIFAPFLPPARLGFVQ